MIAASHPLPVSPGTANLSLQIAISNPRLRRQWPDEFRAARPTPECAGDHNHNSAFCPPATLIPLPVSSGGSLSGLGEAYAWRDRTQLQQT